MSMAGNESMPGTGVRPLNIGRWKDESATTVRQTLMPGFRGRELTIEWEWP
jgi:hypothetical protein